MQFFFFILYRFLLMKFLELSQDWKGTFFIWFFMLKILRVLCRFNFRTLCVSFKFLFKHVYIRQIFFLLRTQHDCKLIFFRWFRNTFFDVSIRPFITKVIEFLLLSSLINVDILMIRLMTSICLIHILGYLSFLTF